MFTNFTFPEKSTNLIVEDLVQFAYTAAMESVGLEHTC